MGRRVERGIGGGGGRVGHDRFLSIADLAESVEQALKPECPGLQAGPMDGDPAALLGRIVGAKHRADLVEGKLEVPQPRDRPSGGQLRTPVAPIAGRSVDLGRPKHVELVVVPQRTHGESGQPREAADRQQVVIHGRIVDPRPGRESSADPTPGADAHALLSFVTQRFGAAAAVAPRVARRTPGPVSRQRTAAGIRVDAGAREPRTHRFVALRGTRRRKERRRAAVRRLATRSPARARSRAG